MSRQWGTVPTRFSAVGTVLAVGLALYEAGRQRRQENRRAKREQSESISAWYAFPVDIAPVINLSNGSQQLVYDIMVFLVFVAGPHLGEDWNMPALCAARARAHVVLWSLALASSGDLAPRSG
jgi:hypothetical protein